ncbi:MAG: ABC transporter substrate-binding protein [Desulfobacterales bacterium]|nr:ABC transporter substrate-binding protein [Desulfobacterales bacterium]
MDRLSHFYLISLFCISLFFVPQGTWAAKADPPLKSFNALVVGERILDITTRLGFAPKAFVGRYSLWEGGENLEWVSHRLGCPVKACKKSPTLVPKALEKKKISHVIIQKGGTYCLYKGVTPQCVMEKLKERNDLTVDTIDFTKGLASAVLQVATLLGCPEKAPPLMEKYERDMAVARKNLERVSPGKRVVILSGTFQRDTGKSFLRVEAPGGYSDKYMLAPMAAENVGLGLKKGNGKIAKGHFTIRKLSPLVQINPDIIVVMGDSLAVQKALNNALAKHPELARVNALKAGAVYSLPYYAQCDPLAYPAKLNKWACMFR